MSPLLLQSSLDSCSEPLIGLEYIVELIEKNQKPSYHCLLCDKKGSSNIVLIHLQCFTHRKKYLALHFPTNYQKFINSKPRTPENRNDLKDLLQHITKKIEISYGRLEPLIVDKKEFYRKKNLFSKKISSSEHIRETPDFNFDLVIQKMDHICSNITTIEDKSSKTETKENINQISSKNHSTSIQPPDKERKNRSRSSSLSSISSTSSLSNYSNIQRNPPKNYRRTPRSTHSRHYRQPPTYCKSRTRNRSRSRSSYRSSRHKYSSRSPKPAPSKSLHSSSSNYRNNRSEKDRWIEFRKEFSSFEKKIFNKYKLYEKNPENHPLYAEEWKDFWNRRYKEILFEKKEDPKKHDFKSEWISFWNNRIHELEESELESFKKELLKKFGLNKITSSHFIDIIDLTNSPQGKNCSKDKKYKRKISTENIYNLNKKNLKHYESDNSQKKLKMDDNKENSFFNDQNEVNILVVLRFLAAIENQLGSFGPKIIDLLSKALVLEKTSPNSSEKLLNDSDTFSLLETVKEKLCGQLMAGILEEHLIRATQSCVDYLTRLFTNIENSQSSKKIISKDNTLIHEVEMNDLLDTELQNLAILDSILEDPIYIPGIGYLEKEVFSQNLASLLLSKNMENLSNFHLEMIINEILKPSSPVNLDKNNGKSTKITSLEEKHYSQALEKMNSNLENKNLSKSEINLLLSKFQNMSKENQNALLLFLKTLEYTHNLDSSNTLEKSNVNISLQSEEDKKKNAEHMEDKEKNPILGRLSPFSLRTVRSNPSPSKIRKILPKHSIFTDSEDSSSSTDEYDSKNKVKNNKTPFTENKNFTLKEENNSQEIKVTSEQKFQKDMKESKNSNDPSNLLTKTKEMIESIMDQLPVKYINKQNVSPQKNIEAPEKEEKEQIATIPTIYADSSKRGKNISQTKTHPYHSTTYSDYYNYNYQNQYSAYGQSNNNNYKDPSSQNSNQSNENSYQYSYYPYQGDSQNYYYQQYY